MNVKFTIKNYRCFEDANPLIFELREGFTALVGPNNSGKSSLLKFFHEFKNLWEILTHVDNIANSIETGNIALIALRELYDVTEIFSDKNDRPLSVEIELLDVKKDNNISKILIILNRSNPQAVNITYYCGLGKIQLPKQLMVVNAGKINVAVSRMQLESESFVSLMTDLKNIMYIGPFRNAINEGANSYYDLRIGTGFIDTWKNWKTGSIKKQNTAIQKVTEDIRNIFKFSALEINAAEQLKTLQINVNNEPYKLRELGSGISQFIMVLGNAAIQNPSYILIDEPELNLHPSLQINFLTSLASYSSKGVIFATHSIGLARSTADRIYSFQKKDNNSQVKEFEQTKNYSELLGEMSYSVYQELGFNKLLLVEGVKDVKVIQQFLRMLKKDNEIVILPLGGGQLANGTVEHELNELKRLTTNISCIVDSEKTSAESQPIKERLEFAELCKKLGFKVLLTEKRAIENYFSDRAIKQVYGNNHSILTPYEALIDRNPNWNKSDNWKIARAMTKEEIEYTDLFKFLEEISADTK